MIGLTSDEKVGLILSVGKGGSGGRRRLTPIEVSDLLERCITNGDTINVLASELQLQSGDMITRFLGLQKLSPNIRALVGWGASETTLSVSAAYELSRLSDDKDRELLARRSVELGFSKKEVQQVVQRFRRAGLGLEEAISRIQALRPVFDERHVIIGAIESSELSSSIGSMRQDQRDEILTAALHKLVGGPVSGRLSKDRFTIGCGPEIARKVMALKPSFEVAVNDALGLLVAEA